MNFFLFCIISAFHTLLHVRLIGEDIGCKQCQNVQLTALGVSKVLVVSIQGLRSNGMV